MNRPPVLILHATGTNRDCEAAWACEMAGGAPEIVHMNQLIGGERRLRDYRMLVLPGGFSYGDDLGAGKLWAADLRSHLADALGDFIESRRPVLGICNGFQALVKAGLLPEDVAGAPARGAATLTRNDSGRFECRWVYLRPQADSPCVFTSGLDEPIFCPVAHGEGKFVTHDADVLAALESNGQAVLRYIAPDGRAAGYPWNPNGSQSGIAGICNARGNVLGLMPHPENHLIPEQHPLYHRGVQGMTGLPLFQNGIRYAAGL
jgi:phosphoribosylformylglycinamidine synthase